MKRRRGQKRGWKKLDGEGRLGVWRVFPSFHAGTRAVRDGCARRGGSSTCFVVFRDHNVHLSIINGRGSESRGLQTAIELLFKLYYYRSLSIKVYFWWDDPLTLITTRPRRFTGKARHAVPVKRAAGAVYFACNVFYFLFFLAPGFLRCFKYSRSEGPGVCNWPFSTIFYAS